ncbi:MAG TPA: cytochrome ubiquinol oxidase subunit I, partial [Modicisalibacter sp.]|nr:cytochrome ubiquinol oxidase subunit I [Modicisalibacter sp.]
AGVSAWYLLRGHDVEANKKALSMSLWLLLIAAPTQAVVGDFHGLNTLEHQPTKIAAIEANWETHAGVPLLLFAIPDKQTQSNLFEIGIPKLGSLILTHEWDGVVPGLSEVPVDKQPPVWITFYAFRVMVALGMVMIAFAVAGLILRRGGRIYTNRVFLQGLRLMSVAPFIAVLAGWITTETGRAPWVVYGMMTHAEGVTPSLSGGMALFTLIGYVVVYAVVFYSGVYYLTRVIRKGMLDDSDAAHEIERPSRPLSAAHVTFDDDDDTAPARS